MNAEPHTHKVQIGRAYVLGFNESGYRGRWIVTYGDQRRTVSWNRWIRTDTRWFRHKVRSATAKAVERHDRESVAAGRRQHDHQEAQAQAEAVARSVAGEWVE